MPGTIILSHGLDSSPAAIKVGALAACAEARGWHCTRPDYRADDALGLAATVRPRLARLDAAIAACPAPPVLVGSSMGAFVSALASLARPVAGLFLLATPPLVPGSGLALDLRAGVPAFCIHGWRDAVCPASAMQAFAAARRLPLLLVDDEHRLADSLGVIVAEFESFLERHFRAPAD